MIDSASLNTKNLRLTALPAEQLRLYLVDRGHLGRQMAVRLNEAALAPALRRAIGLKLSAMAGTDEALFPWLTYWLIIVEAELNAGGLAGFKGPPDAAGEVEIGYGIDAGYCGRGYATESVGALVNWALAATDCLAVTARTLAVNEASAAVLRNVGFWPNGSDGGELLWRINRGKRK